MQNPPATVAMVFAGGLGLAAYHGGIYESFSRRSLPLHWVAGSSAGAVTAALIAGNGSENRIARLQAFWNFPPAMNYRATPFRHLAAWMGAVRTRLVGSPGHFHPRIPSVNPFGFRSLYDLAPMRERIESLVDFGRLNSGEMRVCVAATDIESGDSVIFDSHKERIQVEHLMASCGFLPEFAPIEVDGRFLGDGGLSLNAPFDPILESDTDGLLLYVIDLYARDGRRPATLEAAAERKNDLLFGNQTYIRLKYCMELNRLGRKLKGGGDRPAKVVLLSYRPGLEEPGPEKSFELSAAALAQRWRAGVLDMDCAEHLPAKEELVVVRRT
ncbi:MAG: patatin-like phospholipase family protein [Bradyrhizobium sp.]|jgi:NTE family protein